jgi:hypothetical protein
LSKTEFFASRKLQESGRTKAANGAVTITFLPHNGFDEGHFSLAAITDADGRINELQLLLERAFYDADEHYMHTRYFVADLLNTGLPIDDRRKLKAFMAALNPFRRPADPTAVSPLYSAFIGKKEAEEMRLPSSVLRLSTVKGEKGDALKMAIALAPASGEQNRRTEDPSTDAADEQEERGLLGRTLEVAIRSEFFETFVSQSEVQRSSKPDGGALLLYNPGEKSVFHDGRSFGISLDPEGRITDVRIVVDRKFLDGGVYAGMTRDFAGSFLRAAVPAEDIAKLNPLIQALDPGAKRSRASDEQSAPPGYSVFIGKENEWEQDFAGCTVTLRNSEGRQKKFLSIAVKKPPK